MKLLKKISIVTFTAFIILFSIGLISYALTNASVDPKDDSYNGAESFSENRILTVLDRTESLKFKTYSTNEFPEIECVKITDLSEKTGEKLKESLEKGANIENISYNKILCIELKSSGKEEILEAITKLKEKDFVLFAEPDYIITTCSTLPNDTMYNQQWGNEKIYLSEAWDVVTGSSSVYVGVIDSGIDGNHSEFSNRIETSWCRSFLSGSPAVEATPTDPLGHGTHVAGIIGACGNNNSGVCGVCWNVKLVSLKVIDNSGIGYASNAILAIDYAESKKIPIINMSLRWYSYSPTYNSAMNTAIENYSGLFVCSAGNESIDVDTCPYGPFPAQYSASNMIVVGASTMSDTKADFSNYGATSVDIFAPGENILSTYPASICASSYGLGTHYQNGYHFMDGTSMATPYVAGVAALIKMCHPNISISDLKNAIVNHGDYRSSLSGYCVSNSRINALSALDSTHAYSYTDIGSNSYHICQCTICNYSVNKPHHWVLRMIHPSKEQGAFRYVPEYYCTDCGAVTVNAISFLEADNASISNDEVIGPIGQADGTEAQETLNEKTAGNGLPAKTNAAFSNEEGEYYGRFGRCDIFFIEGVACVIDVKKIAGYHFIHSSSFALRAVCGEETMNLSEAFDRGLLTADDIAELYRIHKDHELRKYGADALYQAYDS